MEYVQRVVIDTLAGCYNCKYAIDISKKLHEAYICCHDDGYVIDRFDRFETKRVNKEGK